MGTWIKRIVAILLTLGVLGAAVLAFLPTPVRVETGRVARGPMRVVVEGTGRARVRDRYVVVAPVGGDLSRMALRAGDAVTAGQDLAGISPPPPPLVDARTRAELVARAAAAEAAERQALAAVDQAKLARSQASRERDRARSLAETGVITTREVDTADFEVRARSRDVQAAELAVETARREIEAARAALLDMGDPADAAPPLRVPVRSPAAGRVLRVLQENGGPVAPGTPLVEIGDPGAIEIAVDVLTTDAVQVSPGAAVSLEQWGGDADLRGVVRMIEPSAFTKLSALGIEEQRVIVVVDPAGDRSGWSALGDGYRVEARIVVWERADALKVPSIAVFRDAAGWAAFRVGPDGRAVLRRLGIGRRNGTEFEVASGLEDGDAVILHPGDQVADGAEVEVR